MGTTDQDQPKSNQDTDIYRKYSHHLGRAEFGSLKRRESMESNTSNLRHTSSFKEISRQSRDSSYDKISTKLSLSRKVSRQDSGEKYVKGQSRMSDTSEAMPDLEVDDELESALSRRIGDSSQVEFKSPSLGPHDSSPNSMSIPMPELRQRQDDAMNNMTEQKKKIKAIKAFFVNN